MVSFTVKLPVPTFLNVFAHFQKSHNVRSRIEATLPYENLSQILPMSRYLLGTYLLASARDFVRVKYLLWAGANSNP